MDLFSVIIDAVITKKEPPIVPKKLPKDLIINSFLTFSMKAGVKTAQLFGVFKIVSNEIFILDDYHFTVGTQPGNVYQVQTKPDGSLFLQGIKSKFVY